MRGNCHFFLLSDSDSIRFCLCYSFPRRKTCRMACRFRCRCRNSTFRPKTGIYDSGRKRPRLRLTIAIRCRRCNTYSRTLVPFPVLIKVMRNIIHHIKRLGQVDIYYFIRLVIKGEICRTAVCPETIIDNALSIFIFQRAILILKMHILPYRLSLIHLAIVIRVCTR